jgi:hypothetical protein
LVGLIGVVAVCVAAPAADATNLPTGAWTLVGNAFAGILQITAVDGSGNMTLSAYGDTTVGFYSATSNTIQFTRQFGATPDLTQTYTGALMVAPKSPGL